MTSGRVRLCRKILPQSAPIGCADEDRRSLSREPFHAGGRGMAFTSSGKYRASGCSDFDCSSMMLTSRKARQRKPSHFGSYCHSLPSGISFTDNASIGGKGGRSSRGIVNYAKPWRLSLIAIAKRSHFRNHAKRKFRSCRASVADRPRPKPSQARRRSSRPNFCRSNH